jgi:hypothetical protein
LSMGRRCWSNHWGALGALGPGELSPERPKFIVVDLCRRKPTRNRGRPSQHLQCRYGLTYSVRLEVVRV